MDTYLLPIFGGILLATYGYWLKKTDERVDDHESRLAGVEATLPRMEKQLDRFDQQLDRLEDKLDGR